MQDTSAGRSRRTRAANLVITIHMLAIPLVALGSRYAGWVRGGEWTGVLLLALLVSAAGITLAPFLGPRLSHLLCWLVVFVSLNSTLGFLSLNHTTDPTPYIMISVVVSSLAAMLFRLAITGDLRTPIR